MYTHTTAYSNNSSFTCIKLVREYNKFTGYKPCTVVPVHTGPLNMEGEVIFGKMSPLGVANLELLCSVESP